MGKLDIALKTYFKDNKRFADVVNTVIYNGVQIVNPDDLDELDTDSSLYIHTQGMKIPLARVRDIIRKSAGKCEYVIYGIENQASIHYAMPLRVMMYDTLTYEAECRQLVNTKKRNGNEYLSKMRKEDRLHPVFTIVIYYGEKPWDGARSLKDMMVNMPEWMEKRFNDYPMNILEIRNCRNTFQNQDIFNLINIIQLLYSDKVEELQRYYANIKVGRDTAELVGTITENEEILNYVKEHKEVGINMCEATKRWERRWEQKITDGFINMMQVRKEGEKNLDMKEAIERLELKGRDEEKMEIAKKMKEKGYSTKEIEELTGILLH